VEDFPLGLVGGCPVLGHVFAVAESRTCGEKRGSLTMNRPLIGDHKYKDGLRSQSRLKLSVAAIPAQSSIGL